MASAARKGGRTGGAAGIRRKTHGGDGRIRPWDAPSRQGNAAGPAAGRRLDTPDSAKSGAEAGEATHWGPGENAGGRISQSAGEQREAPSELHRHPPDGGAVPAPLRTVPAVASRSQRSPVTGPGASGGAGETGSVRRPPLRLPSGRSCPPGDQAASIGSQRCLGRIRSVVHRERAPQFHGSLLHRCGIRQPDRERSPGIAPHPAPAAAARRQLLQQAREAVQRQTVFARAAV